MISTSIFGRGKMGMAIADIAVRAGAAVQVFKHSTADRSKAVHDRTDVSYAKFGDDLTGDLVILAIPQGAHANILKHYGDRLSGKIVVDISNSIDFATYERREDLRNTSAALELARQLPEDVVVLKAFNVNLADTLRTGSNGYTTTRVLFAGDDAEAKLALTALLEAAGLEAVDVGPLQRSRELEAMGYLQITLAATGQTEYESGFTLLPRVEPLYPRAKAA